MNGNIENPNKYGYTLVELLVVLALIGIVLSIAIPSINLIFVNFEKKELMEFKRDMNFARNRALMENGVYTIRIDIPGNKYYILEESDKKSVVKEKEFSNGIRFTVNNLDHSISFYPTGSTSKVGTIRLTNKKDQDIEITITMATGKVNLKIDGK